MQNSRSRTRYRNTLVFVKATTPTNTKLSRWWNLWQHAAILPPTRGEDKRGGVLHSWGCFYLFIYFFKVCSSHQFVSLKPRIPHPHRLLLSSFYFTCFSSFFLLTLFVFSSHLLPALLPAAIFLTAVLSPSIPAYLPYVFCVVKCLLHTSLYKLILRPKVPDLRDVN